ncbi:uncharacterized protein LOC106666965 [Cimex lectularius]|uniref:Osiris n=1 Tax=Cimex lectularius TaxID=79782 RepID=A0A8I6RXZ4_CIMLE|nr:uncharacterized protein LOC106666965 [Cimex lectularius]
MKCLVVAVLIIGSTLAASVEHRNKCKDGKDALGCLAYKALELVEQAITKDTVEVMEGVKLVKIKESRKGGQKSLAEGVEDLMDTHDLEIDVAGRKLTVSPSESGKISLTVDSGDIVEGKGRKSKLRKMLVPLVVFVLLKAMTLIPLALGVLGLKAWNALQLSFFSFVTSLALAIFNLCKKVASDGTVPVAHAFAEPYHYAARNLIVPEVDDAQELAYRGYEQH